MPPQSYSVPLGKASMPQSYSVPPESPTLHRYLNQKSRSAKLTGFLVVGRRIELLLRDLESRVLTVRRTHHCFWEHKDRYIFLNRKFFLNFRHIFSYTLSASRYECLILCSRGGPRTVVRLFAIIKSKSPTGRMISFQTRRPEETQDIISLWNQESSPRLLEQQASRARTSSRRRYRFCPHLRPHRKDCFLLSIPDQDY